MSNLRLCTYAVILTVLSTPALAKNETLAERGKRLCDEAGVPLEDCVALPPALRTSAARPEPRPTVDAAPSSYGTGTYGWCDDCTSLLGAAPVKPWSAFAGRQFEPINADGGGNFTSASRDIAAGSDGNDGGGGDNGNGGGGDNGNGDSGNQGDNGGICE